MTTIQRLSLVVIALLFAIWVCSVLMLTSRHGFTVALSAAQGLAIGWSLCVLWRAIDGGRG